MRILWDLAVRRMVVRWGLGLELELEWGFGWGLEGIGGV